MPVNQQYYYQDQDVEALSYSTDPRIIWAPAVPMDQIGILEDSFKGLKEGERLLLPLQADGHWTGAMVTKDDIGLRITWLDSMHPEQQISDDKLVAFEQALGITLIPKANEDIVLKRQRDAISCGPWMIENLSAASAVSLANETDKAVIRERYDRATEENIRQTHIDELGEVFAEKQLHNNVLENIDPVKLQAFEGSEEEKKAMRDLALVIQRTSPEFQAALDNITEISQVLPEETQASLRQLREAFVEQSGIIDQIDIKVNEPGYLVSLNENVKLQEHSAENSRTGSRASSIGSSEVEAPKTGFGSWMSTLQSYANKIIRYFFPDPADVTGVKVVERPLYQDREEYSIEINTAQVVINEHQDLNASTKAIADMINENASPRLKEALESFVAVSPALSKEDKTIQWEAMKENFKVINAKDGDILDKIQNQGFDYRNVDSLTSVNAYVKGYRTVGKVDSQYGASTNNVRAPNIPVSGALLHKSRTK